MKSLYAILILAIFLTGCYKDIVDETIEVYTEYPETIIESADVTTIVWNEDGILLPNGTFTLNDQVINSNGVSTFEASNIKAVGSILSIRHPLGFDLHYPLLNVANQHNIHKITIPKIENFTFVDLATEYMIPFLNQGFLKIHENGIKNENNLEVSPTNVWFKNFDTNQFSQIPLGITDNYLHQRSFLEVEQASFIAIGRESEELILQNYSIELNSEKALYYFDSAVSRWIIHDMDSPLKTGFYAIGSLSPATVSVLSFSGIRTLDQLDFLTNFEGKILNHQVVADKGEILTYLPANKNIEYNLISMNENVSFGEFELSNNNEKEIEISVNNDHIKRLTYKLLNCDFTTIDNAILLLQKSGRTNVFIHRNQTTLNFYQKDNDDISFQFYSNQNQDVSATIKLRSSNEYRLNSQFLCSSIDKDFIILNAKGTNYIFDQVACNTGFNVKTIVGTNGLDEIALKIKKLSSGLLMDQDLNMFLSAPNIASGYRLNCLESDVGCGFTSFDLMSYEEESGYFIKGTFEGTFWIESINESNVGYRSLSGEFQLEAQ